VPTYKPVETMDDLSLICSSQHINKRGREKIAKEMDHIFTNEMICPYCGEEQTDPCEKKTTTLMNMSVRDVEKYLGTIDTLP